jgi:cell shape-determining protein MreD
MDIDPISLNLASITGIVGITMILVELLKKPLKNFKWFQKIPVFIYSIIMAAMIAFLANRVFHTISGNIYHIIWRSIISAASASGFYTWLRNPESMATTSQAGA